MPNKFNREANYYQNLTTAKKPVSAKKLDDEFNYLVGSLNETWEAVEAAVVGILPGAESPDNRGKVVVAQGNEENPIAFIQIGNEQIQDKSISLTKLDPPANHGVVATKSDGTLTVLAGTDRHVLQFKGNAAPVSVNPVQLFEGFNVGNTVLRSDGKFEKVQSDDLSPKLVKIAHLADDIPLTKFVGGQANQLPVAQGGGAITWGQVPSDGIVSIAASKVIGALKPDNIPEISGSKLSDKTIAGIKLGDKSITGAQTGNPGNIADKTINAANIADQGINIGNISSGGIADGYVITSKANTSACEWRAVPSVGQDQVLWGYIKGNKTIINSSKGIINPTFDFQSYNFSYSLSNFPQGYFAATVFNTYDLQGETYVKYESNLAKWTLSIYYYAQGGVGPIPFTSTKDWIVLIYALKNGIQEEIAAP